MPPEGVQEGRAEGRMEMDHAEALVMSGGHVRPEEQGVPEVDGDVGDGAACLRDQDAGPEGGGNGAYVHGLALPEAGEVLEADGEGDVRRPAEGGLDQEEGGLSREVPEGKGRSAGVRHGKGGPEGHGPPPVPVPCLCGLDEVLFPEGHFLRMVLPDLEEEAGDGADGALHGPG